MAATGATACRGEQLLRMRMRKPDRQTGPDPPRDGDAERRVMD
jgi:hypothetical protein